LLELRMIHASLEDVFIDLVTEESSEAAAAEEMEPEEAAS
jgi:hypothetical protein